METQEVTQLLAQLQQNMLKWDQTTDSLPALLQQNGKLLEQLQQAGPTLDLTKQQQLELQNVMEHYQALIQLTSGEKKKVLKQLKSLDQQKDLKGGPYHQQISDGAMIEIDY